MAIGLDTDTTADGLTTERIRRDFFAGVRRTFRKVAETLVRAEMNMRSAGIDGVQGPARGLIPLPVENRR